MKRILDEIDRPVKRMSDDLREVRDGLECKSLRVYPRLLVISLVSKRTEILRWLSPEPYIQHHTQAKKDVILGTGEWLLTDPVFKRWKGGSESSILWVHGIPGSGKSKLV